MFRINSVVMVVVSVVLILARRFIQKWTSQYFIYISLVSLGVSVYSCIICWFYVKWIQIPISFPRRQWIRLYSRFH